MEQENKVLSIKESPMFYINHARQILNEGNDFKRCLAYLHMAEKLELNNEQQQLIQSLYIEAYFSVGMLQMSVYHCYRALKTLNLSLHDMIFLMLARNFFLMGEYDVAKFYCNVYLNQDENSDQANFCKHLQKEIEQKLNIKPKPRLVNDDYLYRHNIILAHDMMSRGDISGAIKCYEDIADFENEDVRNELAMAYFFDGELQKASDLVNQYGKDTVQDLISKMIVEYSIGNKESFEMAKKELLARDITDLEQRYRVGASFSQVNEPELAMEYMRDYVESGTAEAELEFLYCIACINCGHGDRVKNRLIDLKTVDPFDEYIFDFYIKACSSVGKHNYKYIFNIPKREENVINAKIKEMLVQTPEALLNEYKNNESMFYYIAKQNTSTSNLLLLKLASIDDKCLDDFFDFVLFGKQIKVNLKNRIAIKRAGLNCTKQICVVRDDIFSRIVLPNNLATKTNNINLYNAVVLFVEYVMNDLSNFQLSIAKIIVKIERKIKNDDVDEKVLGAYIAWETFRNSKSMSLSKICNRFKISQEEFYDFTKKYDFEV